MQSGNEKKEAGREKKPYHGIARYCALTQLQLPAYIHPLVSAEQATIYDLTPGMLDVSYAAAWTLSRQMALQDKAFSAKLYNWKRQLSHKMETNTERSHLSEVFANVFEKIPEKL